MTETKFLRFDDEAEWREAAEEAGILTLIEDEEGNQQERWMFYTHDWAVDVIGPIFEGGEWDPETGEELVAPTQIPGYHVNVKWLTEVPATRAVAATISKPATPHRIFLGD